jgi:hypothetical protein
MNKGYEKVKHILRQMNARKHEECVLNYYINPRLCLHCHGVLKYGSGSRRKFCNRSCASSFNNKYRAKIIKCLKCDMPINRRSAKKFCSAKCSSTYIRDRNIEMWLSGNLSGMAGENISSYVRFYLISTRGKKCEKCGWSKVNPFSNKVPLTVNHIDGDYTNTIPSNLELLCPNCHSLTPTYGSLNRGRGRKHRKFKRNNAGVI